LPTRSVLTACAAVLHPNTTHTTHDTPIRRIRMTSPCLLEVQKNSSIAGWQQRAFFVDVCRLKGQTEGYRNILRH
jgi:hypothetical protein